MHLDLFLSLPVRFEKTLNVESKVFTQDKNNFKRCKLLIDTGASNTALTRELVQDILKYDNFSKSSVIKRTAAGYIQFYNSIVSRIEMGNQFAFNNWVVDILEWTDSEIEGVIGMDILSKLHFHSDTYTFTLQNKPFIFQN